MRQILNHYSTATITIVVVLGSVPLTLLAVLLVRKLFPHLADGHFEEIADGNRVIYELVYALVLAFVIGIVIGNLSTADSTGASEASALSQLKRDTDAFPVADRVVLEQGLNQYLHAVVQSEWPAMKDGKESPRASAALDTLFSLYQSYMPSNMDVATQDYYRQAVDELKEIEADRRSRLELASHNLPLVIRLYLPLGGIFILVIEYRPKMPLRAQLIHMGLLCLLVSTAYLLTVLIDYPYSGMVSVSTADFMSGNLAQFWSSATPHTLTPGEKVEPLTTQELVGVWNSANFGEIVFQRAGNQIHGAYRSDLGTVTGTIAADGVFHGWWCDAPTRQAADNQAGDVEWTLTKTSSGEVVFGNWRYGSHEALMGGWDLVKVGGPEPPDLAARFSDASEFCQHP